MADFPYFSLYAADFFADTALMPPAALGAYTRCLCIQWIHGSIPNDRAKVARLVSASRREINQVWDELCARFSTTSEGDFVIPWLADQRAKVHELSEKRAEAGRKGGRPSASKPPDVGKQTESKTPLRASNSDSSSSRIKNPEKNLEPTKQEPAPTARAGPELLDGPTDQHPMTCPALDAFPEPIRTEECRALWLEWLRYKAAKKRKPYTTARGHLSELAAAGKHGAETFTAAINNAMDHEWQGPNIGVFLESRARSAGRRRELVAADGRVFTRNGAEVFPMRRPEGSPE